MNDNELADESENSGWVWEIIDKHDLEERSDQPISAAIVLLTDAAEDLRTLGRTAFQEQALTSETMLRLDDVLARLQDARRLSTICPHEPCVGLVTESVDGALTWVPAEPSEIS